MYKDLLAICILISEPSAAMLKCVGYLEQREYFSILYLSIIARLHQFVFHGYYHTIKIYVLRGVEYIMVTYKCLITSSVD